MQEWYSSLCINIRHYFKPKYYRYMYVLHVSVQKKKDTFLKPLSFF